MPYISDRQFTDYVHNNLALRDIYPQMDWVVQDVNNRMQVNVDINNAVDYMAVDSNRRLITIQERFREAKYANYSDFTVRYMRPENMHEDRRLSEFFKLDADYFIYGIIDSSKADVQNATGFLKYAVINLEIVRDMLNNHEIVIDPNMRGFCCRLIDGVMTCPVNENYDHSSNFVPFDIVILNRVAPEAIEYQEGFF